MGPAHPAWGLSAPWVWNLELWALGLSPPDHLPAPLLSAHARLGHSFCKLGFDLTGPWGCKAGWTRPLPGMLSVGIWYAGSLQPVGASARWGVLGPSGACVRAAWGLCSAAPFSPRCGALLQGHTEAQWPGWQSCPHLPLLGLGHLRVAVRLTLESAGGGSWESVSLGHSRPSRRCLLTGCED